MGVGERVEGGCSFQTFIYPAWHTNSFSQPQLEGASLWKTPAGPSGALTSNLCSINGYTEHHWNKQSPLSLDFSVLIFSFPHQSLEKSQGNEWRLERIISMISCLGVMRKKRSGGPVNLSSRGVSSHQHRFQHNPSIAANTPGFHQNSGLTPLRSPKQLLWIQPVCIVWADIRESQRINTHTHAWTHACTPWIKMHVDYDYVINILTYY